MLAGFAMAVAIHLWGGMRRAVYPHAVGSQAVPIAVIAVPLCFWWGFGIFPKLFVIALICFFPVVVTTVPLLPLVGSTAVTEVVVSSPPPPLSPPPPPPPLSSMRGS